MANFWFPCFLFRSNLDRSVSKAVFDNRERSASKVSYLITRLPRTIVWNECIENTTGLRHGDIKKIYTCQPRESTRSNRIMHWIIQMFLPLSPANYIFYLLAGPFWQKMPREIVTNRDPRPCIASDPSLSAMITELCEGRCFTIRQTIVYMYVCFLLLYLIWSSRFNRIHDTRMCFRNPILRNNCIYCFKNWHKIIQLYIV